MQIQLRQTEIVEALKQYVAGQGFNLQGKTVEITFTAGRKEGGLTADVAIEAAAELPELGADTSAEAKPALSVVTNVSGSTGDGAPVAEGSKVDQNENEAPKASTTSLFG